MTPLPYKPGFGKRGFQLTPPTCRPEQFTRGNPPPVELAEFIRPVTRPCPACGGKGQDWNTGLPCDSCGGSGQI